MLTNFWEGDQLATGLTCFIDEVDSLFDASLDIEPLCLVSMGVTLVGSDGVLLARR